MKTKLTGFKTYRHESNPKEKELHDAFIKDFVEDPRGDNYKNDAIHRISMPQDGNRLTDYLSDREKQIVISTIQWLGSPVGQGFLDKCGFTLNSK